jgi:hypothetical protein
MHRQLYCCAIVPKERAALEVRRVCTRVAASKTAVPRDVLSAELIQEWDKCSAVLQQLGCEESQAEHVLSESFGWAGQKYWRQALVRLSP